VTFRGQPEDEEVALRDRVQNTTTAVPLSPAPNGSDHGSISDNGCVIAYTDADPTLLGSGSAYRVMAWDRCSGVNMVAGFTVVTASNGIPRPKPNQNGSVIVWSSGAAIEHATRSGNSYAQGPQMNPTKSAFGPNVAVSDDGNLVAFEVSNGTIALLDRRTPGSFETISVDENGAALTNSSDPSISGDGRFVTFTFRFTDTLFGVLVRDRADAETRAIAAPARSGEISRDGTYVTYTQQEGEIGEVYVARSSGSTPFNPLVTDLVSYRDGDPAAGTGGSASNPAISEHGRWVSFDSYSESMLIPGKPGFENTGTHVYVRQRRPAVTVDSIDFGTVGGPTNREAIVRSVGMAGFVITSISATGDFSVVGENCPTVLDPGASCVVTVQFGANDSGQKTGVLAVRDESYPGVPLEGTGQLTGVIDRQVPPGTIPPPVTNPPPADVGLRVTPDPVVFGDVVVGTAAPEQPASVENTGDVPITVSTVSLSGSAAGDFLVASDGCTGVSLAPGANCELVLGFTATASGGRSATITVSGSSSTSASAGLRGSGRFDALLEVTPEVAAGGQVVTVVGSGFPASTTVNLVLGDDPAVPVATNGSGGFMLQWLILSGVPQGELFADDVAVVGAFDAEPAALQVVAAPMRPQGVAALSRTGRRYVSR
jgi:hypothetical protein